MRTHSAFVLSQKVPGRYFFLGVTPASSDWEKAPMLHSPRFYADESAMVLGTRVLSRLVVGCAE